ncbi:hypothetical protein GCM10009792_17790 [Microcella alkalica]|uniref:Diguanylate cyclase (GGDEF)-like protein n=1 Tax=Microcella alkalica TaxID=355930 RepID=A0A839E8J6_9MICO|nr:GGDEF domain-containing protein [Microcella alkalica]MBA8847513.1 diguanylate cyclase (GGDEF)-like protein [Microcella alkalica]
MLQPPRQMSTRPLMQVRHFGMPGPVWTLLLVLVAGLVLLTAGLVFPLHSGHSVPLKLAAIVTAACLAAALLVLGERTPAWLLWSIVFVQVAFTATLISAAPTDGGAVSLMVGMLSAAVYAGFWGRRRMAAAVAAAVVVGGSLAVLVGGFSNVLPSAWAAIAVLAVGITVVLQVLVSALEQQALLDPLTGVMNRRGLQTYLSLRRTNRRPLSHRSIAVIDVDDFKQINDDLGHAEGDRVLRELAQNWVRGLRHDDLVVRLGGDEFVLVLSRVEPDATRELLARLQRESTVPWSYGVSSWPEGADFDVCLDEADQRLLETKRARGAGRIPEGTTAS